MPVMRNGTAEYLLSIGIPIHTFSEMLQNATLGEDRVAVIVDRSNTIVARSEKNELYEGTKIFPGFADLTSSRTDGIVEYTNREGIPLHLVFRRLQTTGWLVAVGVTVAVLNASARNTIASTATAGAHGIRVRNRADATYSAAALSTGLARWASIASRRSRNSPCSSTRLRTASFWWTTRARCF